MPYALNLRLDNESATHIERVYGRLAGLHVPEHDLITQYGPCVTILVINDVLSPEMVARTLELHLPTREALAITFSETCIIQGSPPTLSFRVAPAKSLLALHYAIYSEFAEDDVHLHYRPAYWQPHLKLCNVRGGRAQANTLIAELSANWHKPAATLDGLEVVQYSPVQMVWQARLQQPAIPPPDPQL